MPGTRPTKKELAKMKVANELGVTPTAIARQMKKSHHTVIKYLQSEVYNDPGLTKLVDKIRENETNDLYVLGAKGRSRLHELLDEGKSQMIPTIALVDRTFQQRRLLEGKSTTNVASLTAIIKAAHQPAKDPQDKAQEQEGA